MVAAHKIISGDSGKAEENHKEHKEQIKNLCALCGSLDLYRAAAERRNIQPYNQMIAPTKPSSPSQGARAKSSGTSPIGASFEKPTMRPALITPHMLSP